MFAEALSQFLTKTKDTGSVYKRIEALGKYSKDEILLDMITIIFAGFDTISHLICSALYWLKRPQSADALKKLMKSLEESGISKINASNADNFKNVFED